MNPLEGLSLTSISWSFNGASFRAYVEPWWSINDSLQRKIAEAIELLNSAKGH